MYSACFTPTVPSCGIPFPSPGPLGRVPRLPRYYGMLRFPAAHPAALRCLRLAVPRRRRCFRGPACSRSRRATPRTRRTRGFRCRLPLSGSRGGDDRVSQVPGRTPMCTCPALRPRWDRTRQARLLSTARRCCLPHIPHAVGSHDNRPFGALSHGLHTRCLRFAVRVAPTPRKTRFRLPATLCRAGLAARWVLNVRFRRCFLRWPHRSPPHPGFAWRTG